MTHGSFDDEDLAEQLAQHAPDLSLLGPHLGCAIEVRRFADASVVWLNERWFAQSGFDLSILEVRERIEAWMLATYAVDIVGPNAPPGRYVGSPSQLHADRYGNAGGSGHGGSGRVAGRGGFHAKGIGRTPLVSPFADWFHSNGCLWLEEGVREVIFAELVAAEFPHGAVPIIALIDTGDTYHWPDGNPGPHRAILVRADFVRLAHLQRSIFFGSAGRPGSDQVMDADRTRDAWAFLRRDPGERARAGVTALDLHDTFDRIGEQHGHAHAWRLWPGPFFSSNVSLDGQLVDFGSMRALPSWKRARGRTRGHGFGEEDVHVTINANSLARLGAKFGQPLSAERLLDHYRTGVRRGFDAALMPCGAAEAARLRRTFEAQQRHVVALGDGIQAQPAASRPASGTPTSYVGRILHSRPGLYYDHIVDASLAMADTLEPGGRSNREVISNFIRQQLTEGRRHWPHVPSTFALTAQACDSHWSWLVGRDYATGTNVSILSGLLVGETIRVADHQIDVRAYTSASIRQCEWMSLTCAMDDDGGAFVHDRRLVPPCNLFVYP